MLRQVRAKLCRTPALQDRVWTALPYGHGHPLYIHKTLSAHELWDRASVSISELLNHSPIHHSGQCVAQSLFLQLFFIGGEQLDKVTDNYVSKM